MRTTRCDTYVKDLSIRKLLAREDEVELGMAMEDGLEDAIAVIACCPPAIAEILSVAGDIERGTHSQGV